MKSALNRANKILGLSLDDDNPWALVSLLCSEIDRAKTCNVDKSDAWDAISEKNKVIAKQSTLIAELVGALEDAKQYIPINAVECRGDKCREPWCISCFGEDAAAKAIEDASKQNCAINSALTKAREQTNG